MPLDRIFIVAGLISLVAGMSLGLWFMSPMGGDLALLPSHVHFNLLGWATLCLYGLVHRAYPALGESRLAKAQLVAAVAGAFLLPIGFGLPRGSPAHIPLVALGALGGFLAASMFLIMYIRLRERPEREARRARI